MAVRDEFDNHVEETDGQVRVFCANCGDPDGDPQTGYALEGQLVGLGWKKVDDSLVCGDPRCGAALTGDDPNPVIAVMAQDEIMTPEQVGAMQPLAVQDEIDSAELEDFGGWAEAKKQENTGNNPTAEDEAGDAARGE